MKEGESTVKGIILAVYPQGEYGKRISLLSDLYGKITVFAQGAARQNSKIIGVCRPFVCGEFILSKGKNAWNLHGASVMEAFEEIPLHPETAFTGMYFLELTEYFSQEGMPETDARAKLNLLYSGLKELQKKAAGESCFSELLIRRIFELKQLVQEGIYTEEPPVETEGCCRCWKYVLTAGLNALYRKEIRDALAADADEFCEAVLLLRNRQLKHRFRSEQYL